MAPGRPRSSSSPAAKASSSGRKYRRSWIDRTVAWWRASSASSWDRAVPELASRKPSVRAIRVRSASSAGMAYTWVPS